VSADVHVPGDWRGPSRSFARFIAMCPANVQPVAPARGSGGFRDTPASQKTGAGLTAVAAATIRQPIFRRAKGAGSRRDCVARCFRASLPAAHGPTGLLVFSSR
jgi:hypothetical protein